MEDYKKLGLKVGLELHAALDTFKLFCNCFSTMDEKKRKNISRKLHAVPGETGEVDVAAKHEANLDKDFKYQVFNDTTCLIESDDEPPRDVNMQAFDIAMTVANMFNCYIPDEVHFMRKTVINGSNTSGFQRTGLIGLNGNLKTSFGKVGINALQLEEDACGIVSRDKKGDTYRLDRLGIPLLEIVTAPDAHTPLDAQKLAEELGMYLKSTAKVKKGLNAMRQDVNVSIAKGARTEIKGVQSLSGIKTAVELEVIRQKNIVELKPRVSKIRFGKSTDLSQLFTSSDCKILKGKKVYGIRVSHGKGLLAIKIQGEKTIGREIADYVKGKTPAKGFIHSDEDLTRYKISDKEISQIKTLLKIQGNDLFALVSDYPEAITMLMERVSQLAKGVPEETRKFNEDGTTSYMRPLPGMARMYPETDVKPIIIKLKKMKTPELLSKRIARLGKKYKLNKDVVKSLVNSDYFEIFEKYANLNSTFIASIVTSYLKEASKRKPLDIEDVAEIIEMWKAKKISKDGVQDLIKTASEGKDFRLQSKNYKSNKNLNQVVDSIIRQKKDYILENKERAIKPLMGLVMKELRGSVSGEEIHKALEKKIKEMI